MKPGIVVVRFALLLAMTLLGVCSGCRRDEALAKLETKTGEVLGASAKDANAWRVVTVGAVFFLGDALQTKHTTEALLGLDDGSKLRVRQDTIVRFAKSRPGKGSQAFDVDTGEVLLEAGTDGASFATSIGLARLARHSQVVIRRTTGGIQFDVTVGKALFESPDGSETVEAGRSFFINVGRAVVESAAGDAGVHVTSSGSSPEPTADVPVVTGEGALNGTVAGNGVSLRLAAGQLFQPIPPGSARIPRGTTVRVERGSSVALEHQGATMSLSGAGTYLIGTGDSPVQLQNGSLSISGPTRIVVPGGVIETSSQTLAAVETAGNSRMRIRVGKGAASVVTAKGNTRILAGQEATVGGDGATAVAGQGLTYADITAAIGETFVVHDPKPPTAIRFQFASHCPTGGVVRVKGRSGGQFASGEGSAALAFGPGRHEYFLHCLDEYGQVDSAAARGVVTVLSDAGTRTVPTSPPSTAVNVDGRNYTVMYQNQLPRVTVVWPNAPASANYTLKVESRGATKTYTSAAASYTFASGGLPEGRHTLAFEGGGKVSRYTGVEIAFDNAAPMASLSTPSESTLGQGGELVIAGVAQPGWSVEVDGQKVTQDGTQRFSQGFKVPATERAIGVRLTHPTRGTHIYVRRATRNHD